jgi:dihydrofolate reductase
MISAMGLNRAIGKDNNLLWHLPSDLQHFKKLTMGQTVVMGRKTWESIGRPLPGRMNVVLTRDRSFKPEGAIVFHDIKPIIRLGRSLKDEVFIIGGQNIYEQFLPYTDFIYLTLVEVEVEGDAFFPKLDRRYWEEIENDKYPADELNAYNHVFYKFRRYL